MNAKWKILAVTVVFAALFWRYGIVLKTNAPQLMPVKHVRTGGVFQYLTKLEIKDAILPLVQAGFWATDMQAVHDVLAKLPWVSTVSVKREWPDTIDIRIEEKSAYARWGDEKLITEQGIIFAPRNLDQFLHLPKLQGPQGQEKKVLEIMKGIATQLADDALVLTEFSVNDRWSWKMRLTSGMEILLGREDQLKKLQRFMRAQPVLGFELANAIAVADLRYPNGFAVTWKPEALPINWSDWADPRPVSTNQPKKATQSNKYGKKNRT